MSNHTDSHIVFRTVDVVANVHTHPHAVMAYNHVCSYKLSIFAHRRQPV